MLASQRASVPKPSFAGVGAGTGSAPGPRFQLFVGGSASGVTVITAGVLVWSTNLVAAFHVPKTASGGIPVPPNCQSPASWLVEPGGTSKSVMYSDGYMGRPDVSVPPSVSDAPTSGFVTLVGVAVGPAENG